MLYPRSFRVEAQKPLVGDVDEEARIASVPRESTTKGMYFADLIAKLPESEVRAIWPKLREAPRHGKYQGFLDYPFADVLLWLHANARANYPGVSLLEGLRRLGRESVKVFLASSTGKVVKSLAAGPPSPRETLLRMPEMWKITDPQAHVSATEREGGVHFDVQGFAGWLDCGLIGTLEQVVLNTAGSEPSMDVELSAPDRGRLLVRW